MWRSGINIHFTQINNHRLNPNLNHDIQIENGSLVLNSKTLRYFDVMQLLQDNPSLFQHVQLRVYDLPSEQTSSYQERAAKIKNAISTYQKSHSNNLIEFAYQVTLPSGLSIERLLTELVHQEDNGMEFPALVDAKSKYFDSNATMLLEVSSYGDLVNLIESQKLIWYDNHKIEERISI